MIVAAVAVPVNNRGKSSGWWLRGQPKNLVFSEMFCVFLGSVHKLQNISLIFLVFSRNVSVSWLRIFPRCSRRLSPLKRNPHCFLQVRNQTFCLVGSWTAAIQCSPSPSRFAPSRKWTPPLSTLCRFRDLPARTPPPQTYSHMGRLLRIYLVFEMVSRRLREKSRR